jgi:esterase/lipase
MIEKVEIFVNSQKIKGTIFYPEILQDKNPAVIFFTGMTSSEYRYVDRAKELVKKGIIVFTLSYRGHGDSEGDFNLLTVNDLVVDGLAAYNFIASKKVVDKKHIGICGVSVGATVAILTANKFLISSLVLRAPAVYSDEMMSFTLNQLMTKEKTIFKDMKNIEETVAIQSIKKFKGNLLLVVSENDQIIPKSIPQSIYDNAIGVKSKNICIIPEATHNLSEEKWKNQFISKLVDQFSNHL